MRKLIFVFTMILTVAKVSADEPVSKSTPVKSSQIEGQVIDYRTGEALVGVCLKIKGSEIKTYTDLKGKFKLEGIVPGTYDIDIDYVSYKDITLKNVTANSSDVELKVELESADQPL
jgi:hypothetical protein